MSTIGLIGTGIMGTPIGTNLLRAGHQMSVFSRTRSKAEPLLAAGARWTESPAELAANVDVILSIVTDSPDVEAVYLGPTGVCSALTPGTLCMDMTTCAPETARRVATQVEQAGGRFLDAPVSGGRTGAEAGTLSIMVGGAAADLARAEPVLRAIGKTIVHCGPVGAGQLTKLCNQIICGLNLLAVAEALVFARGVGLDPNVVLQAVSKGAAGSWAVDNLGPRMLRRDFAPMFMVDLQQKDLRIALATASAGGVALPGSTLVSQLLAAAQAAGEGREGTQTILKTLERLSDRNRSPAGMPPGGTAG
ncbi:MAG TPA: NAD(P)-dependent oxidoreductase [Phycisphaerae bacterium]|nr:NAD(P)-dependent oxidoreductase [Phycisphaerae bacterium]HNU46787.1 NAD(P)-dependent oxidoreductase [Phycisphaerae bacterium]